MGIREYVSEIFATFKLKIFSKMMKKSTEKEFF